MTWNEYLDLAISICRNFFYGGKSYFLCNVNEYALSSSDLNFNHYKRLENEIDNLPDFSESRALKFPYTLTMKKNKKRNLQPRIDFLNSLKEKI